MTSRASSQSESVFRASFRFSLRSGSICAAIFGAATLVLLPLSTLTRLLVEKKFTTVQDYHMFMLSTEGNIAAFVLTAQTVLYSLLMGFVLFRFMLSVRACNVYASLGIKRSALFFSRYCAGLLLLTACIVLPFLISGLISGILLGFCSELLWSLLFCIVNYVSLAALCYSLFACVACCVGTATESLLFFLLLLGTPSILFVGLSLCSAVLLYGCPYSSPFYTGADGQIATTSGLLGMLTEYNPLTFSYSGTPAYLIGYKNVSELSLPSDSYGLSALNWARPDFTSPLLWLLVAAVIALIAVHAFRHRKMEKAGFWGVNKTLNRFAAFVIGSGCYMLVFLVFQKNTVTAMIAGSFAMLLAGFLVLLLFTRSAKAVVKQFYTMVLQLVSVNAVFLILVSGGFGYAAKLPDAESIAYAEISSVACNTIPVSSGNSSVEPYDDDKPYGLVLDSTMFGRFTTPRDIEQIRSIHSKFIQLGSERLEDDRYLNTRVLIQYTLKNGRTILRYYNRTDVATLDLCLNLAESDLFRTQLQETLLNDKVAVMRYGGGKVVAVNAALDSDSFQPLKLTEKQHAMLKAALYEDLSNQSRLQRYFPETPAIGALWFRLNEENGALYETESLRSLYSPAQTASEPVIYLTADMTQTLAFLEQNDLLELFDAHPAEQIKSISFYPARIDRDSDCYRDHTPFTLDAHATIVSDTAREDPDEEAITPSNPVTDPARIQELLPRMHMRYFTQDSGYYCCIEYQDGSQTRKYLTESDAPDYVRYYNYN